jgi:GNAT superfamily N-acetyltransferase
MKGGILIRSAGEGDFPPLCALYCKSVRCNPDGFIQDLDFHGCLIAKTRAWREAGGDMLVGIAGERVVALGGLAPHGQTQVELCKLHVDETMQGRGLGRLMTEHLIALARHRGFMEVVLHVTTTQKAAVNLYHSIGFSRSNRKSSRPRSSTSASPTTRCICACPFKRLSPQRWQVDRPTAKLDSF